MNNNKNNQVIIIQMTKLNKSTKNPKNKKM